MIIRLLLTLAIAGLCCFAGGAEVGEQTGATAINDSGCVAKGEGPHCVCIGSAVRVTITIRPESEGGDHHPNKNFTVSIDGPASFRRGQEDRTRTQRGCPSRVTYRIYIDDDAAPGSEVTVSVDDEVVWRMFPGAGVLIIYVDQPIPGSDAAAAIGDQDVAELPFLEVIQRREEVNVGHVWWEIQSCDLSSIPRDLRDYANKQAGWSPAARDPRPTPINPEVAGRLWLPDPSDPRTRADVVCCFPLTAEGVIAGLEFMSDIASRSPNYHLANLNCATVAIQVGQAAGAPVPNRVADWGWGNGNDPGSTGEALRKLCRDRQRGQATPPP